MPPSTFPPDTSPSVKCLTLCFVVRGPDVLLGLKKRGFGAGRWNGFGGKVEPGESIPDAARRELREEAGIETGPLEPCGLLRFAFAGDPVQLEMHIFRTAAFSGEPVETEEMRPVWYALDALPLDGMWPDDRYWLADVLSGRHVRGAFHFEGHDHITDYELEVRDEAFAAA